MQNAPTEPCRLQVTPSWPLVAPLFLFPGVHLSFTAYHRFPPFYSPLVSLPRHLQTNSHDRGLLLRCAAMLAPDYALAPSTHSRNFTSGVFTVTIRTSLPNIPNFQQLLFLPVLFLLFESSENTKIVLFIFLFRSLRCHFKIFFPRAQIKNKHLSHQV